MMYQSVCLVLCSLAAVWATYVEDSLCDFAKHKVDHEAMKKLKPLEKLTFSVSDSKPDGFVYNVGICVQATNDVPPDDKWKKAGAVQSKKKSSGDDSKDKHVVGDFTQTEVMGGKNWLSLEYEGGDKYNGHCEMEGRRTIIMMVCDPTQTTGNFKFIEENTNKTTDCYYLFELSHSLVCDTPSSSALGPGSIILIVLVSLIGGYLLLGFMYQRFAKGAQGKEQIPNYPFWQDVGNLAADGCDFMFRSNTRGDGSRQYRGIGDDQITQQTPEDPPSDTDEHLLPM